jgi:sarcosine oxidase
VGNSVYDIIIVGLGAMGSAAAYQLSQSGKRVLGIDQFIPPHTNGSSHGDTRITREAIGEGRVYTPLVRLSNLIWEDLEKETGKDLLTRCGGLVFGPEHVETGRHGTSDFLGETIAAAGEWGIEHQILSHQELVKRYPQFKYQGNEIGYFETGAGFVRPERCVQAQLELAASRGVALLYNTPVLKIEPKGGADGVVVTTTSGIYESEIAIISAGACLAEFLPNVWNSTFEIYRQVLYWFEPGIDIEAFSTKNFGVYIRIDHEPQNMFYGFPAIDGATGGVKFAAEQFETVSNFDTLDRKVAVREIESIYQHVGKYLRIKPHCIRSAVCMYTVTPDLNFVIDRLPKYPQMIVASPCSGHGFKHSAGVGRILKELTLGQNPSVDISSFSFDRFGKH